MLTTQTYTPALAARITGIQPKRLRNHLAGIPSDGRQRGQWRRLTPTDLLRLKLLDTVMAHGMSRRAATASTVAVMHRLFWPLNPATTPLQAVVARCTGLHVSVVCADGSTAAMLDLHEMARELDRAVAAQLQSPEPAAARLACRAAANPSDMRTTP